MRDLQTTNAAFYADMREIILNARNSAVRSIEYARMMMYWHLGERIFIEDQRGQSRAEYGEYLIRDLSNKLESEFGGGFSYTQLTRARKFYRLYPVESAVRAQLNWMQYKLLIAIDDDYKREYYELEAANHAWHGKFVLFFCSIGARVIGHAEIVKDHTNISHELSHFLRDAPDPL